MSKVDDAYVALRNLLKARLMSSGTRESALRAVEQLNREALAKTILEPDETDIKKPDETKPKRAA